jgi:hypothetical protein
MLFTTRPSHALGLLDVEIAAEAGYGIPGIAGAGGRAGVSIFGLYGGVNVVDYFFHGFVACTAACPYPSLLMYGGELGYGYTIGIVTIRPLLGVGRALILGNPQNTSGLYLEPSVTGLVSFGHLFVGVDANLALFPNWTFADAFTIHGQVGVKF